MPCDKLHKDAELPTSHFLASSHQPPPDRHTHIFTVAKRISPSFFSLAYDFFTYPPRSLHCAQERESLFIIILAAG